MRIRAPRRGAGARPAGAWPAAPVIGGMILMLALGWGACAASSSSDQGSSGGSGGSSGSGASGSGGATSSSGGTTSGGSGGRLGTGGATSSGGASSGGSTGAGSGGSSGTAPCTVTVQAVGLVSSSNRFEVGPSVKIRVQGSAQHAKVDVPSWRWTITSPELTAVASSTLDDQGARIEFPAPTPGRYQIVAQVTNDASCPTGTLFLDGDRAVPSFNMRVTAPGFPVQETIVTSSPTAVSLRSGKDYRIEPRRTGQSTVLPAYVRITNLATTFDVEGSTSHGAVQANLVSDFIYDLLIVPDDPTFAPAQYLSAIPDRDWQGPIVLDRGTQVSGLILGPDGAPLANARMILKRGARPSTVGTSDASGALTLWTRPGEMSALVIAPPGSGLPDATVDASADGPISVDSTSAPVMLTMRYQKMTSAALTLTVRDPSTGARVVGARVHIRSHGDVSGVGTLTSGASSSGGATTLNAHGTIDLDVVSDTNGIADYGAIPAGPYDVVIVPQSSPGSGEAPAITTVSLTLPAAGLARMVDLARKVTLGGQVASSSGMSGMSGATVTAIDRTGDVPGSVVSGGIDAAGKFALAVDPNRRYQLVVEPPAGQALARTLVGPISVDAGDKDLGKTTLAPGKTFTGSVSSNGNAVGGAFLQIFCVATSASCIDPTVPLGDATTRSDGTFNVVLPDLTSSSVASP